MDKFDYIYYLKKYKDLRDTNINTYNKALKHWNKYGKNDIFKRYINKETDPEKYNCNIYIIAPIKEGGSYKYINDIIKYLESINKNYIIIRNNDEFNYMSIEFSNKDLLILQNLHNTKITFTNIENIVNKTKINLILPIHDFYFIYSKENINLNVHKIPINIKINHNLFKIAKHIIFPSKFMMDCYINIIGHNDNYCFVPHNDNLNINSELYIPSIINNINIGIITNINYIKGYSYYIKLCHINKYKNYNIHYYLFGDICNKNNFKSRYIHHKGKYNEDDIYDKLDKNNIHGLMFMNKYPEAYCYALTKGINSRLPLLYTDMGAISERLRNYQNNRFHIYNDINSFYNFIDYIIMNENIGIKNELDLEIKINQFYIELLNV